MRDFKTIQSTNYDLIIIGGGINGVGIARDAALRGLKTILLEKGDFARGSTCCSTRLIHGGLRYLEYLEFPLVRESLQEREVLLRTAPHLVHPLQMTIPLYKGAARGYWLVQAGMILYDLLSLDKTVPAHRMLGAKKFSQLFRTVRSQDIVGAAQYYDGQAEYAERLCLENVLDAQTAGATMLNYAAVTELQMGDRSSEITSITCKDQLSDETFTIDASASVIVNTSGPWVDEICRLGKGDGGEKPLSRERKMGGTKGSHIVVEPFPGAPGSALYVEAASDNRPYFIIPWLGKYLIGTTDIKYDGSLDEIKASNAEVDYLLAETNRVLPSAQLTREDVTFTYSGVRPLPYVGDRNPSSITRSHVVFDHTPEGVKNLVSLIGGKLTTYRQVGEEMVNVVYKKLKRTAPQCSTRKRPLPGAIAADSAQIETLIQRYQGKVERHSVQHLCRIYGAQAINVLALVDKAPDLSEPIVASLPDIKAQVVYAIEAELAFTIEDICRRRTTLTMLANYGYDALPVIVDTLQRHCGFDQAKCDRQVADYRAFIRRNCLPDFCIEAEPSTTFDVQNVTPPKVYS
ncbi:Glycerol-3-phosphate dehydrogenase [[Leptolyngbya] sp. PCC 7376]|uniref:glycerol-3-phosphate dehydrogenase n=1 Tax=[Leptolyngbya] sp. PCC 7376 TaxID=111781 RepID=UPI00029F08D4|nr:glycerol-3-phosphate dehydrogenase [[Leptolyngbya] sp. PCC 7376]AFY37187.1 Glycerol-3-phosphate dehydrogenase [[Leptolyngbya] sp. PCC 7376]